MLGWLRSRVQCPVEQDGKQWIEQRMLWLAEQFGWLRLRAAKVVLPAPEYFPDPYNGSIEDARLILDRVCGYMDIEPETVELEWYEDRNPVHDENGRMGS